MRKKKLLLTFAVVVGVVFWAGPVLAPPLLPGETYQEWTFDDDDNPAIPELDMNPYGTATATISGIPGGASPEWAATLFERLGVWQADELVELVIEVPNEAIRRPYKEIYIEIGFLGELDSFAVYPDPSGGNVELLAPHEIVEMAGDWKKLTASYHIKPNPDKEYICYGFTAGTAGVAAVDYVIVNTICIPEPLTICLLGLGGLMLRRRRSA